MRLKSALSIFRPLNALMSASGSGSRNSRRTSSAGRTTRVAIGKPGTALDVGMGQGRNTIWLAQQGWDTTGFDPAEKAVALAQENAAKLGIRIHTEIKGSEDFDFGDRHWDLILVSYVSLRGDEAKLMRALKPGGVVICRGLPPRCDERALHRQRRGVRYGRIGQDVFGTARGAV